MYVIGKNHLFLAPLRRGWKLGKLFIKPQFIAMNG